MVPAFSVDASMSMLHAPPEELSAAEGPLHFTPNTAFLVDDAEVLLEYALNLGGVIA